MPKVINILTALVGIGIGFALYKLSACKGGTSP
ncbi:MAG: hypothetical protein GDYSWBUE_000413 [Candidatus Fervidibacterota bacterium]